MHVGPLQRRQFPDPHAGRPGELIQGGQLVAGHAGQEGPELVGRPSREDAASGLRRVDEIRRVAHQQIPANRIGQRPVKLGMEQPHRRPGQPAGLQIGVQSIQGRCVECVQPDMPDAAGHVREVLPVAREG